MYCTIYKETIRSKKSKTSILDLRELLSRFTSNGTLRKTVETFRDELDRLPPSFLSSTEWTEAHAHAAEAARQLESAKSLPRICPALKIKKQRNGWIKTTYNGIVTLTVEDIQSPLEVERLKEIAALWPMTLAAIKGADGKSLVLLVSGTLEDGTLPNYEYWEAVTSGEKALADSDDDKRPTSGTETPDDDNSDRKINKQGEERATGKGATRTPKGSDSRGMEVTERFHRELYQRCSMVYACVLGREISNKNARIDDTFLWTDDSHPYYNKDAAAVKVDRNSVGIGLTLQHDTGMKYGPESSKPTPENNLLWRRCFAKAVNEAKKILAQKNDDKAGVIDSAQMLEAVTLQALRLGIPQEDTVYQAQWKSLWSDLSPRQQRDIIESVYTENSEQTEHHRSHSMQETTYQLQAFMTTRYDLRFNVLTNGVEWRKNNAASFTFMPLDNRMMNTMIQECHENGLDVYDRDMKRFLGSTRIRDYHVAHDYLRNLNVKWDGKTDYIGRLADRVPCRNPHWREWFHTWYLGMIHQWIGSPSTHANSVLPLLIGAQGCGKSTFGQLLLPPELRHAGYRELVDFTNKQEVERLLTSALLINLDEFNQISEKTQQGFLKNLIQKSSVKGRRPYSSMTQNMPRYASFIATTNMADVLSDPSGSRRFIVADIPEGEIIDNQPSYFWDNAFAQAKVELEKGVPHYFTTQQVHEIESYNASYTAMRPEVSRFLDIFEPMTEVREGVKKMKFSDIISLIKERTGYEYGNKAMNFLSRWLMSEANAGRIRRTMSNGTSHYLVKLTS